jgi:hypothetical protein
MLELFCLRLGFPVSIGIESFRQSNLSSRENAMPIRLFQIRRVPVLDDAKERDP